MANILITGANQGIGYFLAEKLLKDGHHVAVLDIEINRLAALKKAFPDKLLCYQADVREEKDMLQAIADAVSSFHTLDIAVHNACICPFSNAVETDCAVYKQVFDVNYYGALRLAKCVLPHMQAQKGGKVIFTSSGVGITGFAGIAPYASTKGALETLAKCLSLEHPRDNVSFHIFHPPLTRTRSAAPLPVPEPFMADPKKVGYGLAKHIFSKRFLICPSFGQKLQTLACYWMPVKMGRLLSKMTASCADSRGAPTV